MYAATCGGSRLYSVPLLLMLSPQAQLLALYQEVFTLGQKSALYRVAYQVCQDQDVTEDILSTALLKAIRKVHTLQHENLRRWVFAIVLHTAYDWRKKRANQSVPLAGDAYLSNDRSQDDDFFIAVLSIDLAHALESLPPHFSEVFVEHYYRQVSYAELSGRFGASVPALKMRNVRTKQVLREKLPQYDD